MPVLGQLHRARGRRGFAGRGRQRCSGDRWRGLLWQQVQARRIARVDAKVLTVPVRPSESCIRLQQVRGAQLRNTTMSVWRAHQLSPVALVFSAL